MGLSLNKIVKAKIIVVYVFIFIYLSTVIDSHYLEHYARNWYLKKRKKRLKWYILYIRYKNHCKSALFPTALSWTDTWNHF